MVYYPSLPLIIKSENKQQHQLLCSPLGSDTQTYQNAISVQQQQHHQQQLQHQSVSNNVMSSSNQTTTLLIPQSQSFLYNIKTELPQQQQRLQQQSQLQHQQSHQQHQNVHVELASNQKLHHKCEQCNMTFGSKSAHTSHMKSHSKQENNYQLTVASTTNLNSNGPTTTAATTTSTTPTGSDPYQCNVCKKTFAVPARLIRHYRTHTGERPFECEFCHKMFSVKENLQVHRRIHTKERPYKCDVCGRAFEHSGKLHRHMRIHTGERPHKCSVCSKTFIQSGQLVIHMRTHTGEKPYKCPVEGCGKGFTCSKQLKVHSRTHTGEKPYHCDICFRDFGYNHVLKLHRVQHYGSKCYKCTICDETFKSKKEMEAHIKGHANEMPDEDDEQQQQQQQAQSPGLQNAKQDGSNSGQSQTRFRRESLPESERSRDSSATSTGGSILMETPIESSSEANSESGEDVAGSVYGGNSYERLEKTGISFALNQNHHRGSINPALLAAASIASRRVDAENSSKAESIMSSSPIPPPLIEAMDTNASHEVLEYYAKPAPAASAPAARNSPIPFAYESIAVMRQNGYFAPAPVAEFRPSLRSANDIVRRVEAAIAGAEPLLTPNRLSSTESPDRSSSPESDTMMVGDRDILTLPPRKRKLYLNDNQSKDVSPVMRMSSVIQFAKAS